MNTQTSYFTDNQKIILNACPQLTQKLSSFIETLADIFVCYSWIFYFLSKWMVLGRSMNHVFT